jgi:hypothetical protein
MGLVAILTSRGIIVALIKLKFIEKPKSAVWFGFVMYSSERWSRWPAGSCRLQNSSMKIFAFTMVLVGAIFLGANLVRASVLSTQAQAAVMSALGELRFTLVLANDGKAGGPIRYKVTRETVRHLNALVADGAIIVIDSQGKVTIE